LQRVGGVVVDALWEAVAEEESFPPSSRSQPRIVGVNDVFFSTTGLQGNGAIGAMPADDPVLVDLVEVLFASGLRIDVLSARSGVFRPFQDAEDDDVADVVSVSRINHGNLPTKYTQDGSIVSLEIATRSFPIYDENSQSVSS
jgi:hypothetical protein